MCQVSDIIFYYSALSNHNLYLLASNYTLKLNMIIAERSEMLIENPGVMLRKKMRIWHLRPYPYTQSPCIGTIISFQIHLKRPFTFHGLFWPKFLTFLKQQRGNFWHESCVKSSLHLNVYLDIYALLN